MRPVYLDQVPDTTGNEPTANAAMESAERGVGIRRAIEALPSNQRMAVVLRYYEDLDYHAIADAMDTTEKAVERLLARARVALRVPLNQFRANEPGSGGGFEPLARL
jgi:RNA polymerase sigma-70 factor (ECF subfamily)